MKVRHTRSGRADSSRRYVKPAEGPYRQECWKRGWSGWTRAWRNCCGPTPRWRPSGARWRPPPTRTQGQNQKATPPSWHGHPADSVQADGPRCGSTGSKVATRRAAAQRTTYRGTARHAWADRGDRVKQRQARSSPDAPNARHYGRRARSRQGIVGALSSVTEERATFRFLLQGSGTK